MRSVRSRNTAPELLLRRALKKEGIRYVLRNDHLPGRPDLVLPNFKIAIFVDGDLWHGNQWRLRKHSALEDQFRQTTSRHYWLKKIRGNMQRDASVTDTLLKAGWIVLRFWEREVQGNLESCIATTMNAIETSPKPIPAANVPQKTFAEFFAGIGLMRMGLEKQGWSMVYANDIDRKKQRIYANHFRDDPDHFVVHDIHKLSVGTIPTVTLATASFPCNDLSLAGGRKGLRGTESSAFWGFIKILTELNDRRPSLVLLENVTGFLTSHRGSDFREALLALNALGYSVDAFVINAAHFVPQSRERLFVVGLLNASDLSVSDALNGDEHQLRPQKLIEFVAAHKETIRWSIRKLPPIESNTCTLEDILENIPHTATDWWSQERTDYLLSQMSERHRLIADKMINGKVWTYGTVFRRMRNQKSTAELRNDGIAGCLRTPRGGSGRQILFKAGKGKYFARLITPREAARLMGADDFCLGTQTTLNDALFGFGDAVCVPVIEWIATYYLNPVVNELIRGQALTIGAPEVKNDLVQQAGA